MIGHPVHAYANHKIFSFNKDELEAKKRNVSFSSLFGRYY